MRPGTLYVTSIFPKLEGLDSLARRDIDTRPTLVRVVTDLYVQKAAHTPDEERHYTELTLRLLDAVDARTRAAVAIKLAAYAAAPGAVVRRLARDTIEVAEPILSRSSVLTGADLAAIAAACGPDHAAAIALRGKQMPDARPASTSGAPSTRQQEAEAETAERARTEGDLATRFFAADSRTRRALLADLDVAAEPLGLPVGQRGDLVRRLETAALERNGAAFADILALALEISHHQARRIVDDAQGDAVLVAARALEVPSEVLLRILLFLNPAIGQSVQRVFDLTGYYERLPRNAALHMVASLREQAAARPRRHQPVHFDDEAVRGRRGTTLRPGAAPQSRPQVLPGFGERQRTT
jgi:hypothetical protein